MPANKNPTPRHRAEHSEVAKPNADARLIPPADAVSRDNPEGLPLPVPETVPPKPAKLAEIASVPVIKCAVCGSTIPKPLFQSASNAVETVTVCSLECARTFAAKRPVEREVDKVGKRHTHAKK